MHFFQAFFPGVPDLWYSIGQKELFTQKVKTKTNKMKKVKKKAIYVQCGMRAWVRCVCVCVSVRVCLYRSYKFCNFGRLWKALQSLKRGVVGSNSFMPSLIVHVCICEGVTLTACMGAWQWLGGHVMEGVGYENFRRFRPPPPLLLHRHGGVVIGFVLRCIRQSNK